MSKLTSKAKKLMWKTIRRGVERGTIRSNKDAVKATLTLGCAYAVLSSPAFEARTRAIGVLTQKRLYESTSTASPEHQHKEPGLTPWMVLARTLLQIDRHAHQKRAELQRKLESEQKKLDELLEQLPPLETDASKSQP